MNSIYDIVGYPLGYLMSWIYKLVPNYAFAIVIFTLVVRLLMFPINYKTQQNAARMSLLQPKLQKLQKSFSNNPERLQAEQQKLYQEEGLNPMGSCLPGIIQMILLFGVLDVVYKPITHILHISKSVRTAGIEIASKLSEAAGGNPITSSDLRNELRTMEILDKNPSEFTNLAENFRKVVADFTENFTLFGANLGKTPTLHPEMWSREAVILCIIPFAAALSQLLVSVYTMIHQKKTNPTPQAGGGCMNFMFLAMPLMTVWFAFNVPAGVGFYWICSSVITFLMTYALNLYFTPERVEAYNAVQREKAKKNPQKKTFMQKLLEQQMEAQQQAGYSESGEKKSRSEVNKENRSAINEARKRMAEKYGDEFDGSDDD